MEPEDIFQFLPLNYSSSTESEYVSFWWETYTANIEQQNYHVAFLAFHMLYMTAIYFMLYRISKLHRLPYEHSLFHMAHDDETYYLSINSAFSFSKMNERGVFRFLKIAGADQNLIKDVSKFIEDRNNAAHAKGAIFFKNNPDGLSDRISEYVVALDKIQKVYIVDSIGIAQSWKISGMDKPNLKLYLQSEILSNSFTPTELKALIVKERIARPQISKTLDEILQETNG